VGKRTSLAAGLLPLLLPLLLSPGDLLLPLLPCGRVLPLLVAAAAAAAGDVRMGRHSMIGDLPAGSSGGRVLPCCCC
jgi:hypothetical protein